MRDRGHRNSNERGSAARRRERKLWLLATHGREITFGLYDVIITAWVAQCWQCSTLVTYGTMIVDRIIPREDGGTYRRDNIRIHCRRCSCRQGATRTNQLRKATA